MNSLPLISICIPTYNRAAYLEATLESITRQPVFQNTRDIEIAISDNCSADATPEVIAAFKARYPEKISARRQERPTNPGEANFAEALEAGRGLLRKLHNDTLRINDGFLDDCLKVIREYQAPRPLIFFLNGRHFQRRPGRLALCRDLNEFIGNVSFYSTWIGGFSLWAEDVPGYAPLFRTAAHHFAQTEILFRAVSGGRQALVYNPEFAPVIYDVPKPHATKEALRTIFFAGYAPLLRGMAVRGHISAKAECQEMSRFCLIFFVPYYHHLSGQKFSREFWRDSRFLKEYVPLRFYYFIRVYYFLFCLLYKALIPFKKQIKSFF